MKKLIILSILLSLFIGTLSYSDSTKINVKPNETIFTKGVFSTVSSVNYKGISVTGGGKVAQVVFTNISSYATMTAQIPYDDTRPQNTEGTEIITATITPTNANSKLIVDVSVIASGADTATQATVALFKDSIVNALASNITHISSGWQLIIPLRYVSNTVVGSISPTTFKVRAGPGAAPTTTLAINGQAGTERKQGGAGHTSITITEIAP